MVDAAGPLRSVYGWRNGQPVTSANHHRRAQRRQNVALATVVLAGSLLTACTSKDAPAETTPTKGTSLAGCRTYGVRSAPVVLNLPELFLYATDPDSAPSGHSPGEALIAFDQKLPDGSVNASATLFVAPASDAPDLIQEGMWKANIGEHEQWDVGLVARSAITVLPVDDTTQATKVSHSTFTTDRGSASATFDYWAFTANRQRYLLSYARTPEAKTPDAATFFATATGCARSS